VTGGDVAPRSAPTSAYDREDFVNDLRSMMVTPHVTQNANGRTPSSAQGHRLSFTLRVAMGRERPPSYPLESFNPVLI
jgi:hypothetical protein